MARGGRWAVVRKSLDSRPHTLYRFFDHRGELLYIGVSAALLNRLNQHRESRPWWCDVANVDLEHFETREEAFDAERNAIVVEKPTHNVHHNRGNPRAVVPEAGDVELRDSPKPKPWWWPEGPPGRTAKASPWPVKKRKKKRDKKAPRRKAPKANAPGVEAVESTEPEMLCIRCWHAKRSYGPDAKCKPCRIRINPGISA